MKNITVSLFDGFKNAKPIKNVNLFEYLQSDSQKQIVEHIRSLTDKEEIKKWKAKVACITVSGVFESRNVSKLIKHSGYICIDIDANDNLQIQNFEELRDNLTKIKNIAFASLSVSGKGVFCIIPIEDTEMHKEHFEALKEIFKKLGIIIDKGCGDVSRLRCCSYDENSYFNESAIVFTQKVIPNLIKKTEKSYNLNNQIKSNQVSQKKDINKNYNKVFSMISKLNAHNIDITKEYNDWFSIAVSLSNEFGEKGRSLFHLVSKINILYNENRTDNLFSECLKTSYKYTLGTFFHLAKIHTKKNLNFQ